MCAFGGTLKGVKPGSRCKTVRFSFLVNSRQGPEFPNKEAGPNGPAIHFSASELVYSMLPADCVFWRKAGCK